MGKLPEGPRLSPGKPGQMLLRPEDPVSDEIDEYEAAVSTFLTLRTLPGPQPVSRRGLHAVDVMVCPTRLITVRHRFHGYSNVHSTHGLGSTRAVTSPPPCHFSVQAQPCGVTTLAPLAHRWARHSGRAPAFVTSRRASQRRHHWWLHGDRLQRILSKSARDAAAELSKKGVTGKAKAVRLTDQDIWQVKPGSHLVVMVESTKSVGTDQTMTTTTLGVTTSKSSQTSETSSKTRTRSVNGPFTAPDNAVRRVGVDAHSSTCDLSLTVQTTRHPLTTFFGAGGFLLALAGSVVGVFVARRRRGPRAAKAVIAFLLGAIAGFGEAFVLYESGTFATTNSWGYLLSPIVAIAFAALTLLSFRRGRVTVAKSPYKALPAGAVIGRYQLQAVLGKGASGTTFRAIDPLNGRAVALKVLSPELCRDMNFVHRFFAEAELMRRLSHPNCVPLLDFLSVPGQITIVTELVEGVTLRQLLRTYRRLTGEQALGVLRGALHGLGHIHEHGLVHRDVKPDNILVDLHGVSRLIDYGLVRPGAVTGGDVEGSPSYMSPEQITDQPLNPRSDIYACGVILAELLTGRKIFTGPTIRSTLDAHLHMPPPDLAITDNVHPALAAVVATATVKDPMLRYPDTNAFLAALEDAAITAYGSEWGARSALSGAVSAILTSVTGAAGALGAGAGAGATAGAAATPAAGASIAPGTAVASGVGTGSGATVAGGTGMGVTSSGAVGATGASTTTASSSAATASTVGKLGTALKIVAGAAVATVVTATAVIAQATPRAEAKEIITPSEAKTVFVQFWGTVQNDSYASHTAGPATKQASELGLEQEDRPAVNKLPLTVDRVAVARQYKFPATFVAFGHVTDNADGNYYLTIAFARTSAQEIWKATLIGVQYDNKMTTPIPTDSDGFAKPPSQEDRQRQQIIVSNLSQRYADYLNGKNDKEFKPGKNTSDLVEKNQGDLTNYAINHIFVRIQFSAGSNANAVYLSGGSSVVTFSVTEKEHASNSSENADGNSCEAPRAISTTYIPAPPTPVESSSL